MNQNIPVRLGALSDRSYRITVAPGVLDDVPAILHRRYAGRNIFLITDETVAKLYGRRMLSAFHAAGANAALLDIPPGEQSKSAAKVYALHSQLLGQRIKRDSVIIALGGGVVGDLAGFVAATILRGVTCIQIPTTLLAQVDSSVGGKVGIDHPLGKNLIGAFHQPAAVYIDPTVLRTLPVAEFRNGLAEMVKIAAALDTKLFADLERIGSRLRRTSTTILTRLIARSVGLKASVVRRDEFESGLRKTLNLGHTIGHAIEAASAYRIKHGAAVAMGMAAEARIASELGILAEADYSRLIGLLSTLGLPVRVPRLPQPEKLLPALDADKKGGSRGARFVLLKKIGQSVIDVDVPTPFIREVLTLS